MMIDSRKDRWNVRIESLLFFFEILFEEKAVYSRQQEREVNKTIQEEKK